RRSTRNRRRLSLSRGAAWSPPPQGGQRRGSELSGTGIRARCPSRRQGGRVDRGSLASSNRIRGVEADEGGIFIEADFDIAGANVETFDAIARWFRVRWGTPWGQS